MLFKNYVSLPIIFESADLVMKFVSLSTIAVRGTKIRIRRTTSNHKYNSLTNLQDLILNNCPNWLVDWLFRIHWISSLCKIDFLRDIVRVHISKWYWKKFVEVWHKQVISTVISKNSHLYCAECPLQRCKLRGGEVSYFFLIA